MSPSSCSLLSSFSRLIATPLHHHISHFLSEQFATFLQWNRISFRTPLDLLAESREGREGAGTTTREDRREAGGQVMSTTTAPDPRTGGMVSIMVMYRPPGAPHPSGAPGKTSSDQPPTYDSIFLGEQVPQFYLPLFFGREFLNFPCTGAATRLQHGEGGRGQHGAAGPGGRRRPGQVCYS